ncbi:MULTISPECIES: IucA/IucC family protein [Streptomyces]|uniref:IucA/IucC family siderophore biosynthesis protein n=3 Tax=Streptomyces tricolor TaxID=68277 RepID=A0ABS9JJ66_9ACTN|nr:MULTISPECIES: IucA/IucC family protein [Streptomyces]MCG0065592.1 IucA/IucC family siderophore biosynthesis protein [Streptomyces tricolor]MYU31004.1 IucA/IucC family siderophore biosynthesis protein [Streptomyces sp. SID7810]CUW32101.1 N(2)-citryl-N(6)-acetyl-N(6)-hydroxylysine synthase [Streptomyces reticuli]
MDRVDLTPPTGAVGRRADAYATAPLLNCLLREVAEPLPGTGEHRVHRLPGGRLLRVRAGRRPTDPELCTAGTWRRIGHPELVKLVAEELRRHTGLPGGDLPAEMIDSREAVAALLTARARATAPADPYLRSEQSLLTGHPYHPAPKARGGGPVTSWLPYAPEAHARFPLVLLGVREDQVAEEGDTRALDALGTAPPGYRLLPAHPWQLDLVARDLAPAFADGRLLRLGTTAFDTWPTAAVRTVYEPVRDLFLKFSLDVRITNDIRRLWRHDLGRLRRTDTAAGRAFAALGPSAAWLSDRGYRTAAFAFEELAVLVRDGLRGHLLPGATPLLAAGLAEGFEGSPLAAAPDPAGWWEAYLRQVVPPALTAFADHGVVLEAHLQNTLVAVDAAGTPVQALFRDAEGTKLLPDTTRAAGWERLVYCLVVNHLVEIAGALADHHPGLDPWPAARRELARHDLPEIPALLTAPTLPGKTNLLLRWTGADGADARYLPLPNPLAD